MGLEELWIVACVRFPRARKGRSVLGEAMSFAPQASLRIFCSHSLLYTAIRVRNWEEATTPDAFCGPDLTGFLGFVEMDCGHV